MDTTEIYIKMCGKLVEEGIEPYNRHYPQAGDYYFAQGRVIILPMVEHIPNFCSYECMYLIGEEDEIWLPRQDQLQEMVGGFGVGFIDLWTWRNTVYPHMPSTTYCSSTCPFSKSWKFTSWEQLWLAFCVEIKYGKIWNGEDWEIQ